MKKKVKILCTLGPSSLNKKFLDSTRNLIDLYRLNLSHLSLDDLEKYIIFLKKNKINKLCIDTEGAQIRTHGDSIKVFKKKL